MKKILLFSLLICLNINITYIMVNIIKHNDEKIVSSLKISLYLDKCVVNKSSRNCKLIRLIIYIKNNIKKLFLYSK